MGRSEKYVRTRLNDQAEFMIGDLEAFCVALGLKASEVVERAERMTYRFVGAAGRSLEKENAVGGGLRTTVRPVVAQREADAARGGLMDHLG